jgi:hypothetical protein
MSHDVQDDAVVVAAESEVNPESNLVWGAEAIGIETNRTAAQVRRLFALGFFQGAVWKAGHRTYVGDRRRLRGLANR